MTADQLVPEQEALHVLLLGLVFADAPDPAPTAHALAAPGPPATVDWLAYHRALTVLSEPGVGPLWRAG